MEDEAIVELYWSRSEEAVRQTAEKYGGYCLALSMHILDSRQDAEGMRQRRLLAGVEQRAPAAAPQPEC